MSTLADVFAAGDAAAGVPIGTLSGIWTIESGASYPNNYVNDEGYGGLLGTNVLKQGGIRGNVVGNQNGHTIYQLVNPPSIVSQVNAAIQALKNCKGSLSCYSDSGYSSVTPNGAAAAKIDLGTFTQLSQVGGAPNDSGSIGGSAARLVGAETQSQANSLASVGICTRPTSWTDVGGVFSYLGCVLKADLPRAAAYVVGAILILLGVVIIVVDDLKVSTPVGTISARDVASKVAA